MTRALALAVLCSLASCQCGTGPVTTVGTGFRVAPGQERLDFGRILEGTQATRTVTLIADGRLDVQVTLATVAPFDAPLTLTIPGGDQFDVPVSFHAGNGKADGTLALFANQTELDVALTGVGVRPPNCTTTVPCHVTAYSLEQDACVESLAADETPCDPGSLCLERGRCRAGACVGVARTCDDDNPCTIDACDMATGCVYRPATCPAPTGACRVATCDPQSGCGTGPAPDLTPCGPIDCTAAHVCDRGGCTVVETPEGFPCADPLICLGQGTCHAKKCERPDASVWVAEWTAPLARRVEVDAPALVASNGSLFFTASGLFLVALDAGVGDGGSDGGLDGGGRGPTAVAVLGRGLVSYTTSGFERFATPFLDGPERLVNGSAQGLATLKDGGLRLRSRATGELLGELDGPFARPEALSRRGDGALVGARSLWDGGVELVVRARDGGVGVRAVALSPEVLLAHDEADGLWALEPSLGVLTFWRADGGLGGSAALAPLSPGLAVSNGTALLGGAAWVRFSADGGPAAIRSLLLVDGGVPAPLARFQLAGGGSVVAFHRRCEDPLTSCAPIDEGTFGRAFDQATGTPLWEAEVLPGGVASELVDASLVSFTPGTFTTLVRADFDSGTRSFLEVYSQGQRVVLCPLPGTRQDVRAGLFTSGRLLAVLDDGDGGSVLEALPLTGLPLLESGWPTPGTAGNAREAVP